MVARLREKYDAQVATAMREQYQYQNVMQVPKLTKIVVNIGMGEALTDANALDRAADDVAAITGQKPIINRAKRSIANFRLREGNPIGVSATLRGERMYEFLDRLLNIALPRVRDFRGVPTRAFDGRGNYTLGIRDHLVFPEIDPGKVDKSKGLNVTIVTTAGSDDRARVLLRELGMPFGR